PSPDTRFPSFSRCAQRVEGPCAAAMGEQHEKSAGDRQILLEMQELVAIAELGVKEHRGDEAESGTQQRGGTGGVAGWDAEGAPVCEGGGGGERWLGDAERLQVGERRRIARELAPGLVQEYRREQEAAGKRGRRRHR